MIISFFYMKEMKPNKSEINQYKKKNVCNNFDNKEINNREQKRTEIIKNDNREKENEELYDQIFKQYCE